MATPRKTDSRCPPAGTIERCANCGDEFTVGGRRRLTCSSACAAAHEKRAKAARAVVYFPKWAARNRPGDRNMHRRERYETDPTYRAKRIAEAKRYREANRKPTIKKVREKRPPPQPIIRNCQHCTKPFILSHRLRKTCSLECRKAVRKEYKANWRPKDAAKARERARGYELRRKRKRDPVAMAARRAYMNLRYAKLEAAWKIIRELSKTDENLRSILGELNDLA
jgi:predicted nucleic acid binding AN1-type Zn finger protein